MVLRSRWLRQGLGGPWKGAGEEERPVEPSGPTFHGRPVHLAASSRQLAAPLQPTEKSDQLLDSTTARSLAPTTPTAPTTSTTPTTSPHKGFCEHFPVSVDTSLCGRGHVWLQILKKKWATCPSVSPNREREHFWAAPVDTIWWVFLQMWQKLKSCKDIGRRVSLINMNRFL